MQRIFVKRFVLIMVVAVGLMLLANFFLQTVFSEYRAQEDAALAFTEIAERITDNKQRAESLSFSLRDGYVMRARAFAEVIAQNPAVLESNAELQRLTRVLSVDALYVTDGDGVLRWGSIPEHIGLDFNDHEQTRTFLPALSDKDFSLAQEPRANAIDGTNFQYFGVARQDHPGIVQVGVAPAVLEAAMQNTRIDRVIAGYNVRNGMNLAVFDPQTSVVVGDSNGILTGKTAAEMGIDPAYLRLEKPAGWAGPADARRYSVFAEAGGYLVGIGFTTQYLYDARRAQMVSSTAICVLLGLCIVVATYILLRRLIIRDMEKVNCSLERIGAGGLDVVVDARSTPEFVTLSTGINSMVESLRRQMDEIVQQTETLQAQAVELEEQHSNFLSGLQYARRIQDNMLPSPRIFDRVFADSCVLWEPRDLVGGDFYWIRPVETGTLLCMCDCTGHGTPGALLTMLVVSALDALADEEVHNLGEMLWKLDSRLSETLNATGGARGGAIIRDGADLALLFITPGGEVSFACTRLHLFVCNGESVVVLRGQKLSIGDGSIRTADEIETQVIPANPDNAYFLVSDGLFEQVGGAGHVPFGYNRFKQIILENHSRPLTETVGLVWDAFTAYMGDESRRDDVTLLSFRL